MIKTPTGTALALLLQIVVIGLVGCTSTPVDRYAPDPSVTAATGATLYGSREENPNPFVKDLWVNVAQIDGRQTWANSKEPIIVSPGSHTVMVSASRGSWFGGLATPLTFEAGKVYRLRGQMTGAKDASVWLEEQGSGVPVSDKFALCFRPSTNSVPIVQGLILQALNTCK